MPMTVATATHDETPARPIAWWLAPAFFASGFAALIYQVVWQRVLFAGFGINIEAVTIVVSAFLAGLGIGSLAGGKLSIGNDRALLRIFATVEMSIGAYGLISVRLFRTLAEYSGTMSQLTSGTITFVLVLIPTIMMGFTLPLLVAFAVRQNGNVGSAVGQLYFVNTAGSALASLSAAAFMMGALGESRSVLVAAALNIAVSLFVLLQSLKQLRLS
jgi:predicted membrane-bound spermidine synthase